MSLYPQAAYGQPAAYTSNYPQPVSHHGYSYGYPQQSAVPVPAFYHHPLDANSFRRDYTNRLAELTINSRPIIQSLSMLAQEYARFSNIVAECLESHIRRVPPWMKLPAFYLLDAISKNVYEPYARVFAAFVTPLFLDTYAEVDQPTKGKMEEMLLTWRTGSPTGKELFGVPPQVAIERGVWGDGGDNRLPNTLYGPPQVTKSQVLSELEFTLGQQERVLQSNPYDTVARNHINVLHQLRRLVETGVRQEELQQILNQLRALTRTLAPPVPQAPWQPPPPPAPSAVGAPVYPSATSRPYPPMNTLYPPSTYESSVDNASASTESASASHPPPIAPANIANLLSTLVKAGVVSANGTPIGAGATAREDDSKSNINEELDLRRESARSYRQTLLSRAVQLNTADILKKRPRIVDLLYDRLGSQCKQCGIRFDDTAIGKKKMEEHLDMHFRQNRKASQNVGRGHSRSWFICLDDWIHDVLVDVKGKGRADGSRPLNSKTAAAMESAKREAELRALYVVVPPGDEAKPLSCPICKETLKSEFLEDEEEWVWKNAIQKDDRVYHATCHAEAMASTNTFAARLRTEVVSRSRSGTPEAPLFSGLVSVSTPPAPLRDSLSRSPRVSLLSETKLAGTKRKVEQNDAVFDGEAASTPPSKKLALSSSTSA